MLLKCTRHHRKIARLFLSNEDWELVRHCSIPLLLVKGKRWKDKAVFIASVDPNHQHEKPESLDSKLISSSLELSALIDGDVHVFHSDWVPPLSGLYPISVDAANETDKFHKLANSHGISSEFCHWSDVEIEKSLPDLVSDLGANVVVMGAISRSRLDRVLIGSTAERVLDCLNCDVLIIKPD